MDSSVVLADADDSSSRVSTPESEDGITGWNSDLSELTPSEDEDESDEEDELSCSESDRPLVCYDTLIVPRQFRTLHIISGSTGQWANMRLALFASVSVYMYFCILLQCTCSRCAMEVMCLVFGENAGS